MTTTNDTTTTAGMLQPVKKRRGFDLYAAPGCDPNILAATPQLVTADDGTPQLALASPDGTPNIDDAEIVLHVTFIKGTSLVFVRTRSMGLVMNQDDYLRGRSSMSEDEFHARDLRSWVSATTYGLMHHTVGRLDETAEQVWHIAGDLLQGNDTEQRLAQLLMLNSLLASPEVVLSTLRALRDEYVAAHPELQMIIGEGRAHV